MESMEITRLMKMINALEVDEKLELLSKLSESLKNDFRAKEKLKLLEELSGSWSDTKDDLIDDIVNARSSSDREIQLD